MPATVTALIWQMSGSTVQLKGLAGVPDTLLT